MFYYVARKSPFQLQRPKSRSPGSAGRGLLAFQGLRRGPRSAITHRRLPASAAPWKRFQVLKHLLMGCSDVAASPAVPSVAAELPEIPQHVFIITEGSGPVPGAPSAGPAGVRLLLKGLGGRFGQSLPLGFLAALWSFSWLLLLDAGWKLRAVCKNFFLQQAGGDNMRRVEGEQEKRHRRAHEFAASHYLF